MWQAIRAELAYFRPWLIGGYGIAAGVVIIVSVVFYAVGEDGPPGHAAAGIRGMFMIMAPLILGFVIQEMRREERRTRLLLAGPLTPRQLAGVNVLLPLLLLGVGVIGAGLMIGIEALLTGGLATEALHIVGYVGGMIFVGLMIGQLIPEATVAYRERRRRAAVASWAGFGVAMLLLAALTTLAVVFQGPLSWPIMHLGNVIVAAAGMAASVALYSGRTDFTR
jgi:hypothetical protein